MTPNELLKTEGLSVVFGGLTALSGVSISLYEGEVLSIIGPNGAGKTTLFNTITGAYRPTSGRVTFRGGDITGLPPHRMARLGVARTFQNLKPFAEMSVTENVLIGREVHTRSGFAAAALRTTSFKREEQANLEKARDLVKFVGLEKRAGNLARNLTYGEQKLLEIARALALEPKVLLLDEPVAGMNPTETSFVMELVRRIRDLGITVVLIEHDMRMVMEISERICVLDHGELIAEGNPAEIRGNRRVIEAYLGGGKIAHAR